MMKAKPTILALTIILSIIVASLATSQHQLIASAANGRNVDLFSNKIPCDGRGPNQTSGAFAPQELVILYTLVTYNDGAIANKLASFVVTGPANPYQTITIIGVNMTNSSGIAEFSFRVPWPEEHAEDIVFGVWHAIGTVDIAEVPTTDHMDFRVGWIVRIKSITTLNDHFEPQTSFLRRSTVIFDITAESIACIPKSGTIVINVKDSMNYPIMFMELDGLTFPVGESYFQASSVIPDSARLGEALVLTAPYTDSIPSGGVLYSPAVATTFQIITRDIGIQSLIPSETFGQIGSTITITMTVENKGNQTESFDASTYFNHTIIQTNSVIALPPSTQTQVVFTWDTHGLPEGDYILSGIAGPVEGEIETDDNQFTDGIVSLYDHAPPQTKRDVAITLVTTQPSEAQVGDPVHILVQVKNLGDQPEGFNVTVFYDGFPMTVFHVILLLPGAEHNLTYTWDTSSMFEGLYTIKAYIPPLPDEQNVTNNQYTDGTVHIIAPHPPVEKHDVAVANVTASTGQALTGDPVGICVEVSNLGDFDETFNVTVYAGMLKIGGQDFLHLGAHLNQTVCFSWDTSGLSPGNYTIWAIADPVPGEADTTNNYLVDGTVILLAPADHYLHDVAVIAVRPERQSVFIGEEVEVHVRVKNLGNATQSFNVTLYYDSTSTGTAMVHLLAPNAEQILLFEWNTSNVGVGNYTLKAHAEPVPGETNLENNWFTNGVVEVKELLPSIIHDIAVIRLSANTTEVGAGENVTIDATVQNLGDVPESFNLTIYYDANLVQTITIESLAPNTTLLLTTMWNTKNVEPGTYVLNANATILPNEVNTKNNFFEDGQVSIRPYYEMLLWLLLIPSLIGLALIALLLLLLLRRRRRKRPTAMLTYAILSHPHI